MDNNDCDYIFKIILVGDSNVGKSHILSKFSDNHINMSGPTIGIEFYVRKTKMYEKNIKLQFWDTAGQERYRSIISAYYRGISAAIFVYDITDNSSFENIEKWYNEVNCIADKNVKFILIGNKLDLNDKRTVSYEKAKKYAKLHDMLYFETSSINNINISISFETLIFEIYKQNIMTIPNVIQNIEHKEINHTVNVNESSELSNKKSCAC